MTSDKVLKVNGEEFEEVSPTAQITSKWLVDAWEHLGRPETPLSESGEKMMAVLIAVWEELYPEEAKEWHASRSNYKKNELSIPEQIRKHTGRSLASYPFFIFQAMRKIFPTFKPGDRVSCMKLVRRFPMFRLANKI